MKHWAAKKRRHQDWFDGNDAEIEQMIAEKRRRLSIWQNDIRNAVNKQQYHGVRSVVPRRVREMENIW